MHSNSSPVSSPDDFSTRPVTDQPQDAFETNDDSDYHYDYDSDADLSSDSWFYDDYDESSETDEPSPNTAHLIGDNGTLRLPSGKIISARREKKRYHTFIVRRAELRRSDMQSLAGVPLTQQQALLAMTHKQIEKAERTEKRFTGKMDQLGNIKISERFVNDVPGGKAHKNRFFAR
ncbi:hypothetical protein NEMBOFW57_008285 [Staphylotrichum longicolle]|uniref:Uncharacterized protein n=1 Tax=Staphylotrichum longicolle TaxID=669026 RepID=A0AAD4ER60_9PEZI|nr:hypothetical protein NEMBOFW57_008285 [Staphylotrichum longicolle]